MLSRGPNFVVNFYNFVLIFNGAKRKINAALMY